MMPKTFQNAVVHASRPIERSARIKEYYVGRRAKLLVQKVFALESGHMSVNMRFRDANCIPGNQCNFVVVELVFIASGFFRVLMNELALCARRLFLR